MTSSVRLLAFFLTASILSLPSMAQEPTWTQKFPLNSPSARQSFSLVQVAVWPVPFILLYGGIDSYSQPQISYRDTWVWDGLNWKKLPSGRNIAAPTASYGHSMTFDAARGEVVLFGGFDSNGTGVSETWVWRESTWTQKFPLGTPPPARSRAAMAYDAARGEVVLFGGLGYNVDVNETWVWDGSTWTQKFPPISPPGRFLHAMAQIGDNGGVLMTGGQQGYPDGYPTDSWVWDGSTWTQVASLPSPRGFFSMAYDLNRRRMVLFGGGSGDTLLWDPETNIWNVGATTGPSSNTSAPGALAYDSMGGQAVLFRSNSVTNDTWVWGSYSVHVSPSNLSFGNQKVFTTSTPQQVNVINTGTVPVTISDPLITYGDFVVQDVNCLGASIDVGSSCTLSVQFRPTATGIRSGSLLFLDCCVSGHAVSLVGNGKGPKK